MYCYFVSYGVHERQVVTYHFFSYIAWHEMGCNRVKVGCTYGIYLKVVYTMWGIYHANYDIFHAIKVAKEVCMD